MQLIDIAVPFITFFALTAVGMDLTVGDLHALRQRQRVMAAGLLAPLLFLPLFALFLLDLFRPDDAVAAGLLLIAACPIGGISTTYSYLAGATPALSVTLTTVSSILAFATIPAISRGFELWTERSLDFAAPAVLPAQLLLMLVLPTMLGMWVRHRWPHVAQARRAVIQRAAFAGLGVLLTLVIASDVERFLAGLSSTVPLAVTFVVGSLGAGWVSASAIDTSRAERFTIAVEFATRNVAVATAIAVTILKQPAFALFAATYFISEVPILLVAVALYRRRSATLLDEPS